MSNNPGDVSLRKPDADSSSSGDEDDNGGALISLSDLPADKFKTLMGGNLPPAWHAQQLQRVRNNRFTALVDLGEALPDAPPEPKLKHWIPGWGSSFWGIYLNLVCRSLFSCSIKRQK